MRTSPVLLLTAALLAGCLAGDAPVVDDCPASALDQPGLRLVPTTVDPIDDNRDNATLFETTNVRTCTLPAIGWHPLHPSGTPHRYIGELDMRGDLDLGVVAVPGNTEPGGAYLVDITQRAQPQVLSYIPQPGAYVVDAKISEDGLVLYLASQNLPAPEFADALPNPVTPAGFTVYDIRDRTAPAYLGTVVDDGVGCHMLEPVQLPLNNGLQQDAVMCISSTLRSYLIQRTPSPFANLGFVPYLPNGEQDLPTPPGIPAVGDPTCMTFPVVNAGPALCALADAPHDMTAFHAGGSFGAGHSYLVVSHWGQGVKVLDITDAPAITEVGSWNGDGATHYAGNVHTAMMFLVGTQRYIVASPEYTSGGTVPSLWVLDASDLGNLRLVAEWWHPGNHMSQGLYLTTHQWQVAPTGPDVEASDVRIYLSYNHAGVWVLDLGHILAGHSQAAILGFNLARTPLREDAVAAVGNAVLSTWDVNVVDGHIYGSDRSTGLWVFHYTGDDLGDTRLRGFA
jgi:hypothetical protein